MKILPEMVKEKNNWEYPFVCKAKFQKNPKTSQFNWNGKKIRRKGQEIIRSYTLLQPVGKIERIIKLLDR